MLTTLYRVKISCSISCVSSPTVLVNHLVPVRKLTDDLFVLGSAEISHGFNEKHSGKANDSLAKAVMKKEASKRISRMKSSVSFTLEVEQQGAPRIRRLVLAKMISQKNKRVDDTKFLVLQYVTD